MTETPSGPSKTIDPSSSRRVLVMMHTGPFSGRLAIAVKHEDCYVVFHGGFKGAYEGHYCCKELFRVDIVTDLIERSATFDLESEPTESDFYPP